MPDVAQHIEARLDGADAAQFAQGTSLDAAEVAAFLAHHINLFTTAEERAGQATRLLLHTDWRVPSSVASGLSQVVPTAPAERDY